MQVMTVEVSGNFTFPSLFTVYHYERKLWNIYFISSHVCPSYKVNDLWDPLKSPRRDTLNEFFHKMVWKLRI